MDIWEFFAMDPNFLIEHSGELLGGWEVSSGKVGRRSGDTTPTVEPYCPAADSLAQAAKRDNLKRYAERVAQGLWPLSDEPYHWDDAE